MKRGAVIEQQCGAGGERTDLPVPHHPAAGCKVEEHVVRFKVSVQYQFLQVLQQGATSAVNDALRFAGGAG